MTSTMCLGISLLATALPPRPEGPSLFSSFAVLSAKALDHLSKRDMAKAGSRTLRLGTVFDCLGKAQSGLGLDSAAPSGEGRVCGRIDRLMKLRPARDTDQRG